MRTKADDDDDAFALAEQVKLRTGAVLRLEVDRKLSVILDPARGKSARLSLPAPDAGVGGHEFILSPNERFAALFMYSGQSEEGYELFAVEPSLRHVASLPYVGGEGLGPAFSPDEAWIALASAKNPALDAEAGELPLGDDGTVAEDAHLDWAELRLQRTSGGPVSLSTIRIPVPKGAPAQRDESGYPEGLSFPSKSEVQFTADWGETFRLPIPLPATFDGKGPYSPKNRRSGR
jgi:hypothetical protein